MIGQVIEFDGHRLNDLFYTGEVDAGLPSFDVSLVDARRGSTFRSTRLGTLDVAVTLVAKPVEGQSPRVAIDDLLSWLDVDSPRWLSLSSDDGLKRRVIPVDAQSIDSEHGEAVTVTFTQTDPYLVGAESTVRLQQQTTSVSLTVGGSAPTAPTLECRSANSSSSNGYLWGVSDEVGNVLKIVLPNANSHAVAIDCESRTVTVDGVPSIVTLDSSWFEFSPGQHTVSLLAGWCGASISVRWNERYHR